MATERKLRRGTEVEHQTFTGASGELTAVTDIKELRLHDGLTPGGHPIGDSSIIKVKSRGMVEGTTVDNTAAWANILQNVKDGQTIDLENGTYRIFANIAGIPSSSADPTTDRAISESLLPAIRGKKNITIKNGTVYAANQGTSPVKCYYPNTLTLADCEDITLNNVNLESRGASYGDADASSVLTRPGRHLFLQYNSGNALLMSLCKNVIVNGGNMRLCGSVGVIYTSSCSRIVFNNVFANAASLGYAAFAHDSWVGSTGNGFAKFKDHEHTINSCSSYAETLTRREDNAPVGSSTYSTKGCVVIEDEDVKCFVNGGVWKDAYPNGSAKDNGFAFNANISTMHVSGAYVENCHAVGNTGQSANGPGILMVDNVVARGIRHSMHICMAASFSSQRFHYTNCDVEINGTGVWPGDGNRARENSCVISNLKAGSAVYGHIDNCRIVGPKTIVANDAICYGYLKINNSYIVTSGYGILSEGWGGGSRDFSGIVISDSQIRDISSETDSYIQYTNLDSPSSYSHIHLNFTSSTLNTTEERPIYAISINGSNLLRAVFGFDKIYGGYGDGYPSDKQQVIKYKEQRGLSGGYRRVVFEYPDRCSFKPKLFQDNSPDTGPANIYNAVSAVGPSVINVDGNLEQEWLIGNTDLTLWTVGQVIPCSNVPNTNDDDI